MKRLYGLLLLTLLVLLTACGDAFTPTTPVGPIDSPTTTSQPTTTPSLLASGKFQEYALPQDNSGMMRPAIDHEGRIWFGEMNHNFLAMFDPRTGTFMQIKPLHGAFGIMGIEVGTDDSIWYAEQYANYIGRYFPATRARRSRCHPRLMTWLSIVIATSGSRNSTPMLLAGWIRAMAWYDNTH